MDGHAVLGDFGAAAFYDQSDLVNAQALEQIEVRAFGCLFEELLERVDLVQEASASNDKRLESAQALCRQCLVPLVKQRPLFRMIEERLALLAEKCC